MFVVTQYVFKNIISGVYTYAYTLQKYYLYNVTQYRIITEMFQHISALHESRSMVSISHEQLKELFVRVLESVTWLLTLHPLIHRKRERKQDFHC